MTPEERAKKLCDACQPPPPIAVGVRFHIHGPLAEALRTAESEAEARGYERAARVAESDTCAGVCFHHRCGHRHGVALDRALASQPVPAKAPCDHRPVAAALREASFCMKCSTYLDEPVPAASVPCPSCKGLGRASNHPRADACVTCEGAGTVPAAQKEKT